jgi:hypothetical protein
VKTSTRRRRAVPAPADAQVPLPLAQPPGPDSAAIGGDELRARAYVKAALGETEAPAPAGWSNSPAEQNPHPGPSTPYVEVHHHHYPTAPDTPPRKERTFDLSWITADKPRLAAVAAGALIQPAWYALAKDAGPSAPIGMAFMTGLVTGYWRLRYASPITRWLFTLNLSTAVLYLPAFALITTVLTGAR